MSKFEWVSEDFTGHCCFCRLAIARASEVATLYRHSAFGIAPAVGDEILCWTSLPSQLEDRIWIAIMDGNKNTLSTCVCDNKGLV